MSHENLLPPQAASTLLTRSVDRLIRGRWWLLGLALLLTVAAWPMSRKLAFDQSIESLYSEDDPHLRDFVRSRKLFGGDEFAMVAYSEPELFVPGSSSLTEVATERIQAFANQLDEIPGIMTESTQNLARAFKFPYRLETVRKIVVGVLVGEDAHTTAIVLRLRPEKESPISRGETIKRIRQLAAEHDPPAMVVGEPVQIHDMFRYVEEDGRKLFGVSLGLLALVLMLLLRQLRWVVLPLIVVIVSITWTEAILVLSRMKLSMVSSMLNSLMTIISVQTAMHVSLYFREQHRSASPIEALRRSMIELAGPVWWTVATTAFGFGVLVTSHINPVASFGVMMAVGTLVVFVAVTMLLPGCVLMGHMSAEPEPSASDRRIAAALGRITLWVEHHPKRVTLVSLGVVAFAGAGFSRLRVETDFSKNFREQSPIVQSLRFVETQLGGAGSWEVNFPAPEKPTAEYMDRVRAFAVRLRTEFGLPTERELVLQTNTNHNKNAAHEPGGVSPRTSDERPVLGLTPSGSPEGFTNSSNRLEIRATETAGRISKVLAITDGLDLIPESIFFKSLSLETRLELLGGIQRDFVTSLYNPKERRMRVVLRAYERQPSETKLKLIENVERLARESFPDVATGKPASLDSVGRAEVRREETRPHPSGLFVLLAFLIESLMDDQWTSFLVSTIGITSMMWYAFRRLPIGLMSLVPNLFPNILVIGFMGWIGLPINIATAMIACVSMGLTVDSSIIYIDGYHRARATGLRVHEALHETHRDVGRALVYSNIALMSGFSVLALSHFIPLIYFGLLVSLAMFGGLIGNLVFLPLLIGWWDGRKET